MKTTYNSGKDNNSEDYRPYGLSRSELDSIAMRISSERISKKLSEKNPETEFEIRAFEML